MLTVVIIIGGGVIWSPAQGPASALGGVRYFRAFLMVFGRKEKKMPPTASWPPPCLEHKISLTPQPIDTSMRGITLWWKWLI